MSGPSRWQLVVGHTSGTPVSLVNDHGYSCELRCQGVGRGCHTSLSLVCLQESASAQGRPWPAWNSSSTSLPSFRGSPYVLWYLLLILTSVPGSLALATSPPLTSSASWPAECQLLGQPRELRAELSWSSPLQAFPSFLNPLYTQRSHVHASGLPRSSQLQSLFGAKPEGFIKFTGFLNLGLNPFPQTLTVLCLPCIVTRKYSIILSCLLVFLFLQ